MTNPENPSKESLKQSLVPPKWPDCTLCSAKDEEIKQLQETVDILYSQEPCPKCGLGLHVGCMGCEIKSLQSQNSTLLSLVRRCENTLRSTPCPKCVDEINGGEGHGGAGCYLKETLSLIEKAGVLG